MTLETLAEINDLSLEALSGKLFTVVGVDITIPDGSRLPYDVSHYKLNNIDKRRDALLEATWKMRYVDHRILKMEKHEFDAMIQEVVAAGLLRENGSNNPYGANRYDTAMTYSEIRSDKSKQRIKAVTDILSSGFGHFLNAFGNQ